MKFLLLLWLLPSSLLAQSANQYLVTKKFDTIDYRGDLLVNHDDIAKWKTVKADEKEYDVDDLEAIYFNNTLYINCDGRHFYKKVVTGKLNVFALHDEDTIPNAKGNLRRRIYIQDGIDTKPLAYTARNLGRLLPPDHPYRKQVREDNAKKGGGRAMVGTGIGVAVPTVVIGGFLYLIGSLFDDQELKTQAGVVAVAGVVVGGGLIGGGVALESTAHGFNLQPVYDYNAE